VIDFNEGQHSIDGATLPRLDWLPDLFRH